MLINNALNDNSQSEIWSLFDYNHTNKQPFDKLQPLFYGLYRVLTKVGKVSYVVNVFNKGRLNDVFHVFCLKKKLDNTLVTQTKIPLIDEEGKFILDDEGILEVKVSVKPHIVWGFTLWFHHIGGICCWYLGALDRLGGIHLHGAPSLHGIGSFDDLWLGESHFSLAGWLCLLVWLSSHTCLPCWSPLGFTFDGYGACYLIMVWFWYTCLPWMCYILFLDDSSSPPRG
jgi:hypothetical protein